MRIVLGIRCSFISITLFSAPVNALTFNEALDLAHKNDPTYLSAQATFRSAQERTNIAQSALRPQISFSANKAENERKYVTGGQFGSTDNQKFGSNSVQLNLTQALWRHADSISLSQAEQVALQSQNQMTVAEQDLLVRFLQAWFDVMSARDNIQFTKQQTIMARKYLDQTTRARQLGLVAEPELEDAKSRHEKAIAEQTVAENEEEIKLSALEQIVGPTPKFIALSLPENIQVDKFPEKTLSYWLDLAERTNPAIVAAMYGEKAASEEVRKQRAGHEPTLDLTGSYGRTAQGEGTTPTQSGYSNTQRTIGLQLNIPIYSGNGQSAKVREAFAQQEKTQQELENTKRSIRSACKQAWFNIQSGIAKHTAATQAVKSAKANVRSATVAKERALKTDLDIFKATQDLFASLRDLQNARYEIFLNRVKLKAVSNQLTKDDVLAINESFTKISKNPDWDLERLLSQLMQIDADIVESTRELPHLVRND